MDAPPLEIRYLRVSMEGIAQMNGKVNHASKVRQLITGLHVNERMTGRGGD
jgi:hypothetical protein